MRWPWRRGSTGDRLVVAWSARVLTFVRARPLADGSWDVRQMGREDRGTDDAKTFADRLSQLGLKGGAVHVMLGTDQYQFLQVEAPSVPAEELRSATRYLIRDMIDTHIDDVTLDVLKVGDGEGKAAGQLFVVVAKTSVIRDVMDLARAMQWKVPVVDIQKMAQRNVQSALAARAGLSDSAVATLMVGERQASLTICAKEELFYTRRIDLPEGFAAIDWTTVQSTQATDGYTPVGEYVPDYAGTAGAYGAASTGAAMGDGDKAQRLLVEVQRSLDLWDRTWTAMPLAGVSVFADDKSALMAQWLTRELGQNVTAQELGPLFPAWAKAAPDVQKACAPLLGLLLRPDTGKA